MYGVIHPIVKNLGCILECMCKPCSSSYPYGVVIPASNCCARVNIH